MRPRGSRSSPSKLRLVLAREAARLMYEEEVAQYFVAKRMAAKRVLGRHGARGLRFRPRDLPSNGEIQQALLQLAELTEGEARGARLFEMRALALEVMRALEPFEPRLIGSVATGHVRRGSDIDIQVFAEDPDDPERRLIELGWEHTRDDVLIRRPDGWHEYQHLRLVREHPIELTVYPRRELRRRPRSSTDGQPIDRLSIRRVEALLRET
ncbi:MAG: nucleotidyltransferase domain-containing protein [Sandaracinaceae bacterium]